MLQLWPFSPTEKVEHAKVKRNDFEAADYVSSHRPLPFDPRPFPVHLHSTVISSRERRPWQWIESRRTWANTILAFLPASCAWLHQKSAREDAVCRSFSLFLPCFLVFFNLSVNFNDSRWNLSRSRKKTEKSWILNRFRVEDRRVIDRDSIGY